MITVTAFFESGHLRRTYSQHNYSVSRGDSHEGSLRTGIWAFINGKLSSEQLAHFERIKRGAGGVFLIFATLFHSAVG